MVVLAAAVLTKTGRTLLSRQFVDMSRIRVEGLLSAFTKLLDTSRQYTYFETDNVRYLYQPIETVYLVIITNRSSNIVEDLDTLQLLGRLIPETCTTTEESDISAHAFELLFSFDEVVQLGYRESVTLDQVATNLKMDSMEAWIAAELMKSQREHATQLASEASVRIKKNKQQGHNTAGGVSSKDFHSDFMEVDNDIAAFQLETTGDTNTSSKGRSGGGMILPSRTRKLDLVSRMRKRGEIDDAPSFTTTPSTSTAHTSCITTETFHLKMDEKINAVLNRDGGVSTVEVKGEAILTVTDSAVATAKIRLSTLPGNNYAFKIHPNINKQFFNKDNVLQLKDVSKGFPRGTNLSVLRWRLQNAQQGFQLPLTVSCWPTDNSVTIEYELESDIQLTDVVIEIPMPHEPSVNGIECGDSHWNSQSGTLVWNIGTIGNDNTQGSLECSLTEDCLADDFFPVAVNFRGEGTLAGVKISDVASTENGASIPYSTETVLSVERYEVE